MGIGGNQAKGGGLGNLYRFWAFSFRQQKIVFLGLIHEKNPDLPGCFDAFISFVQQPDRWQDNHSRKAAVSPLVVFQEEG